MSEITLEQAERIIDAIIERARESELRPISAVVVEPGAVVKAFKKEDGSAMLRFEMAYGKAYASLALGRSSDLVRQRAEQATSIRDFAGMPPLRSRASGRSARGRNGQRSRVRS